MIYTQAKISSTNFFESLREYAREIINLKRNDVINKRAGGII